MRYFPIALALALVLLSLGACAASKGASPTLAQLRGSWHLTGPAPAGARVPTVTFGENGAISGNAGVNTFKGTVDAQALQKGHWQVALGPMTLMAGAPEAMAFEQQFIAAMTNAREALVHKGVLELKNGDQVLLRLEQLRRR